MIVMKFGGTSVQDAQAVRQMCKIVAGKIDDKPVVVVSAMARVTDTLLNIAQLAAARRLDDAVLLINELNTRHYQVARELLSDNGTIPGNQLFSSVSSAIQEIFVDLESRVRSVAALGELTLRSQDTIVSYGEILSSRIVAATLQTYGIVTELVDAREFIITNDDFTKAVPDLPMTEACVRQLLLPILRSGRVPVMQGFIGATPQGITTTIGRGGSDYSAAIIGAALAAQAIEIWTDVDGLMTGDPRIVKTAQRIPAISFAKMAKLANCGAKVLHPNALEPAIKRHIPIFIYNTLNPSCAGTVIVERTERAYHRMDSIACRRGVTILNITTAQKMPAYYFLRTVIEVLETCQAPVDIVAAGELWVRIMVNGGENLALVKKALDGIGEVAIQDGKAIVCVVGDDLTLSPRAAAYLLRVISSSDINIISRDSAGTNLTFSINENEMEEVVQRLH
ncbi:MAG: aspartate kinase, partial [Acidobacteriota bacterium]